MTRPKRDHWLEDWIFWNTGGGISSPTNHTFHSYPPSSAVVFVNWLLPRTLIPPRSYSSCFFYSCLNNILISPSLLPLLSLSLSPPHLSNTFPLYIRDLSYIFLILFISSLVPFSIKPN